LSSLHACDAIFCYMISTVLMYIKFYFGMYTKQI